MIYLVTPHKHLYDEYLSSHKLSSKDTILVDSPYRLLGREIKITDNIVYFHTHSFHLSVLSDIIREINIQLSLRK